MVLNSIANTLTESLDLSDSLHRTLPRQLSELFSLDASSLYLFDSTNEILRRVAAVGHRSEFTRHFPPTKVQPELLHTSKPCMPRFFRLTDCRFRRCSRMFNARNRSSLPMWLFCGRKIKSSAVSWSKPIAAGFFFSRRQFADRGWQPDFERDRKNITV